MTDVTGILSLTFTALKTVGFPDHMAYFRMHFASELTFLYENWGEYSGEYNGALGKTSINDGIHIIYRVFFT